MFICSDCKEAIGPRVSPVVMVVDLRKILYRNFNADREQVTTAGWEIAKEAKLCRPCAKMEPATVPAPVDVQVALAGTEARHEHARRCKKVPDECKVCQSSIAWFNSLPLQTLSDVLLDRGANHSKKGH